jgi:uncharacterized protein
MTQTTPDHRGSARAALAGIVLAVALVAPAAARAHISVHPNTVPAGAFATLDVRVPGEQAGAHVTKVDMLLPNGFTSAAYQNVPGWKVSQVRKRLARPIQTSDGPVTQEVSQIIWTWIGPLGRVDNGQFIDFPLSVAIPDNEAGKTLRFKAVQYYSNGQVVRWIETSLADPNPAATINVTAKGGILQDVAGAEAGPGPGQTGASGRRSVSSARATGGASDGLAIAALIVGALGLVAGLGAILMTRRRAPDRDSS